MDVAFTQVICGVCGGVYALTTEYKERKQRLGGYWNCPYCKTGWGYDPKGCELAKAKRAKEEAETRLARERLAHDRTKNRLTHTRASRNSIKGQVTKLKNSVAQGKCPLCKKQFDDLTTHMTCTHPGWGENNE